MIKEKQRPTLDDADDLPDIDIPRPKEGFIKCAFSSAATIKVGTGATTRQHKTHLLWFVRQIEENRLEISKINDHHVPTGDPEIIGLARLVENYTPELEYYETHVLPAMEKLEDTLDQGDEFREKKQFYSAEQEYGVALGMDEGNVRALFGLGLVFIERGEKDRTRELLIQLVNIQSLFDGRNQHLFNEFGIALRKAGMFDEATAYYRRALDFVETDEHLYYNLGRACYENGDWHGCMEALAESIRLAPKLDVTRQLVSTIVKLSENDEKRQELEKPQIPEEIIANARKLLTRKPASVHEGLPLQSPENTGRVRAGRVEIISQDDIEMEDS